MKLKTIFMMLFVALCAVACSNQDEITPITQFIGGNYPGILEMTVADKPVGSSAITVTLTATSDETVSISIVNKDIKPGGMNIHHIEFDKINVTNDGSDTYILSKEAEKEGFTATDQGASTPTVWNFKSFNGQIKKGLLTLDMIAQPGAMPMPITLKFTSQK